MVTDATVPSLVLLTLVVLAVVLTRVGDHALRRRAAASTRAVATPRATLRLPRVVLLDDDRSPAYAT